MKVWNDDVGLYGIVDCLEIDSGKISIVEYKPSSPREGLFSHDDAMQVFAQKICADAIFKCNVNAFLYFNDVKKRVLLPFDSEYTAFHKELIQIVDQMRHYQSIGKIPEIQKGQNCSGCSMKDLCLPKAVSSRFNVKKEINAQLEGVICENF